MKVWQNLLKCIDKNASLEHNLRELIHAVFSHFDLDACSIFILTQDKIYTLAATSLTPLLAGIVHIHAEHDAVGEVALREEAINIDNIYNYELPCILTSLMKKKTHSLLGIPIIQKSQVIGILTVQKKAVASIPESVQTILVTLCTNFAAPLSKMIEHEDITEKVLEASDDEVLAFDGNGLTNAAAIGIALASYNVLDINSIPDKPCQSDNEVDNFKEAVKAVKETIAEMALSMQQAASKEEAQIFDVYTQILESNRFYDEIIKQIENGVWIQTAIKNVVQEYTSVFDKMDDSYLKERSSDIKDIGKRILLYIQKKTPTKRNYYKNTVLVAHEITPSMLAEIPKGYLKAGVSEKGTEHSHAAIIARALGVPFIIGVQSLPISYLDGKQLIVDSYVGRLYVNPGAELCKAYGRLLASEAKMLTKLKEMIGLPCCTKDLRLLKLKANVGLVADLDIAIENDANGIGLYRTEIPFMIRDKFPSEEEQRIIYAQFLQSFPHNTVTIRTLDVGSDKSLPYFSDEEENPALGWRGIRMMLDHTDLFLTQIRAMLKASSKYNNLKILLPMVTQTSEVKEALALINQAYKELIAEGYAIKPAKVGIMIEVPSIVYQLPQILQYVDFVSVGTNDLTQYILAVDRNNSKVAALYSQLHPAVIQVLYQIATITKKHNKSISLCGELASNPRAVPLLIGMGFDELSMNAVNLLKAKWILRHITYKQCINVLEHVLKLFSTEDIHLYLSNFLIENELGGMIRTGSK